MSRPTVSRITIGRLHNLGDYEHVRYEVVVDVPEGSDAGATLAEVSELLDALVPVKSTYDDRRALAVLTRAEAGDELTERERSNLDGYRSRIAALTERQRLRQRAITRFSDLGGSEDWRGGEAEVD